MVSAGADLITLSITAHATAIRNMESVRTWALGLLRLDREPRFLPGNSEIGQTFDQFVCNLQQRDRSEHRTGNKFYSYLHAYIVINPYFVDLLNLFVT